MSSKSLQSHYHRPNLVQSILDALTAAGADVNNLKRSDFELFDEFHIRGKEASFELASMARLESGQRVLDLGCGIGGPARYLAAEFGCEVVGLDLLDSYCEAGAELTRCVGLDHLVSFQQGDMIEMPFPENSFDCVWSQHTWMNIPNKKALAKDIYRVLRPGALAVVYEVCCGNGDPIELPVPWASTAEHSFLCSENELRATLVGAGFQEKIWENVTHSSLSWFQELAEKSKNNHSDVSPEKKSNSSNPSSFPAVAKPGLSLLMGSDAGLKGRNMRRNLSSGKIEVVRGVFQSPVVL